MVTVGVAGALTVNVALLEGVDPQLFVKTAWYLLPVSVACAVNVYVVEVAPVIFVKVFDPLGAICHCTVLFTPSTAVKVAVLFGQIVRFAGLATMQTVAGFNSELVM